MSTYFNRRANRQTGTIVLGYVCLKRDLRTAEEIRCTRAANLVTAKSFGY